MQNSSPILRSKLLARKSAKLIANFSATKVTSLPSLSLSLSLSVSLSLSPSAPHAQYRKRFHASYNLPKAIGNRKKIVREVVRGNEHYLRKSANCNAQISVHSAHCTDLCIAICRFSQGVIVISNNFTHNHLFYFQ